MTCGWISCFTLEPFDGILVLHHLHGGTSRLMSRSWQKDPGNEQTEG